MSAGTVIGFALTVVAFVVFMAVTYRQLSRVHEPADEPTDTTGPPA